MSDTWFFFQWVPEISHHCQKTPFLLVGTQIDLRDDAATIEKLAKNKQRPLTMEMGEKLAKELRAVKYVECSALTQVSNKKITVCLLKSDLFRVVKTCQIQVGILYFINYFCYLSKKVFDIAIPDPDF